MSLLDEAIGLVGAQIAVLTAAAGLLGSRPGVVADIGLGNGRTYDHLRECLPDREIYAFDLSLKAATASVPPADRLILGDIRDTAPYVLPRMGARAVLVHCDIGCGDPTADLARSCWLPDCIARIAADDAIVVSRLPLESPSFAPLPPRAIGLAADDAAAAEGRLHLYRFHADGAPSAAEHGE